DTHASQESPVARTGKLTEVPQAADRWILEGDVWTIRYMGRTSRFRDSKGLRYLASLLRAPGREMVALDLAAMAAPTPTHRPREAHADERRDVRTEDPLLDAAARTAYRDRLLELREEIDDAERIGDAGRVSTLRDEFEVLTHELTRATGIGGRARDH